jgi:hypothetical protein
MTRKRDLELGRREVLHRVLALGAAGVAAQLGLPSIARALENAEAAGSTRRFIFAYFPGGWDQLLFLDPRDPEADNGHYADENRGTTLTEAGYGVFEGTDFDPRIVRAGALSFGPATIAKSQKTAPITKHADRIAIVRGINMGTLGHEAGYRYFLTGRFPVGSTARGTSVATECAGFMQAHEEIPVLALQIEAYNDAWPGLYTAMRVDNLDDLFVVLERGKDFLEKDPVEQALAEYTKRPTSCAVDVYDRDGLLARMRDADDRTRGMLASKLSQRFRFATGTDAESVAIRERYGFQKGETLVPGARGALAAQAIKQGIARCVSVAIGNGTDTHFNGNRDHAKGLHPGIAALSSLIDDLATSEAPEALQKVGGRTWLDHTTILAFSEFARTPMFNPHGGRDHHLSSSCLLAGAGIAGGKVVGESGAVGMGACRYDVKADKVVPDGGEAITPEHLRATLLASASLPWEGAGVHAPPIRALLSGGKG